MTQRSISSDLIKGKTSFLKVIKKAKNKSEENISDVKKEIQKEVEQLDRAKEKLKKY